MVDCPVWTSGASRDGGAHTDDVGWVCPAGRGLTREGGQTHRRSTSRHGVNAA